MELGVEKEERVFGRINKVTVRRKGYVGMIRSE